MSREPKECESCGHLDEDLREFEDEQVCEDCFEELHVPDLFDDFAGRGEGLDMGYLEDDDDYWDCNS